MRRMRRTHLIVVLSFLGSFLVITLWMISSEEGMLMRVAAPILYLGGFGNGSNNNNNGIECYFVENRNKIREISTVEPTKSTSIFFHETSCGSSQANTLVLTARQACAVESAAKMNPDSEVYLLFTAPVAMGNASQWSAVVQQLLTYDNVRVMHLDFDKYVVGTPLEEWYRGGALKSSQWPRSHASDVLRFLTLWKYGGTYLDLDVVVTRSLRGLQNFAGAESWLDVAAGVLNFAADGPGHRLAEACIEDLRTEFRGDDWGNNGPGVITRVLKRNCKVKQIREMSPEHCQGFTVHPPPAFYPIPWRQWRQYFDESTSNRTMARLADSIAIHVWNKFSIAENITVGSRQPYALIAHKYCPRVYAHCGRTF